MKLGYLLASIIFSILFLPVANAQKEYHEVNRDSEYFIQTVPSSDGAITGLDLEQYICGLTPSGQLGDDCTHTTKGKLVFHYDISETAMGNQIKFKIENTGSPAYVDLDISLCWKLATPNTMICDQKISDLYEGETDYITMFSIRSEKYFIMIDAKEGSGGDETLVKVSREVVANSNNDRIEPELIFQGQTINAKVCDSTCQDGVPDPSDIFVFEAFAGDEVTVWAWSREGDPLFNDEMVKMYWRHEAFLANYTISKWYTLDETGSNSNQEWNKVVISGRFPISGLYYIYFIADGNSVQHDEMSYSIRIDEHDKSGRDLDADLDGDGMPDVTEDICGSDYNDPSSIASDHDSDGSCDAQDLDDDNDGFLDINDECQFSPQENNHDNDGCTDSEDSDDDNDGVDDDMDSCPLGTPDVISTSENDYDSDGCLDSNDPDDDNDGWSDVDEVRCSTSTKDETSVPDDYDNDGVCDLNDDDDDNDGVLDIEDAFPKDENENADTDGDGVGNNADTNDDQDLWTDEEEQECNSDPLDLNSVPDDYDGDGQCDLMDSDDDNDGVPDIIDSFPFDSTESSDHDGDGIGDFSDYDDDGDMVPDVLDNCHWISNQNQVDIDEDGAGDVCDDDKDGDGFVDMDDVWPRDRSQWADTDRDGYGDNLTGNNSDAFPIEPTQWKDTDGDGYGDNPRGSHPDSCPLEGEFGEVSTVDILGCQDSDGDGWADPKNPNSPAQYEDYHPDDPRRNPLSDKDGDGCLNDDEKPFLGKEICKDQVIYAWIGIGIVFLLVGSAVRAKKTDIKVEKKTEIKIGGGFRGAFQFAEENATQAGGELRQQTAGGDAYGDRAANVRGKKVVATTGDDDQIDVDS